MVNNGNLMVHNEHMVANNGNLMVHNGYIVVNHGNDWGGFHNHGGTPNGCSFDGKYR